MNISFLKKIMLVNDDVTAEVIEIPPIHPRALGFKLRLSHGYLC